MTCQHCGKTDFDESKGCKHPVVYSPAVGDWSCAYVPFKGGYQRDPAYVEHKKQIEKLRKQLED